MRLSTSLAVLAAVLPAAFAEMVITDPNNNLSCSGGKTCTIKWQEGPNQPPIAQSGTCEFSVYTGNPQQQTRLQTIAQNVNIVHDNALVFTVDPKIGPSANVYFIRAQCSVPDPTTPSNPLLAFSGFFSLNDMTGTFNASVQAQVAGIPNTSLPGGTFSGVSTTGPVPTNTNTPASTTSTSPRSTGTNTPGDAAVSVGASQVMMLLGGAVALAQFF
jgi:hypothetical protein